MKAKFALFVFVLVIMPTVGMQEKIKLEKNNKEKSILLEINFPDLEIKEGRNYLHLSMKNASYTNEPYFPHLPIYKKTITFPMGTKIIDIQCIAEEIKEIKLNGKVAPSLPIIPLNGKMQKLILQENEKVYSSYKPYPKDWIHYDIKVGLYNGKRLIFIPMIFHPVKYYPALNKIEYAKSMKIKIVYEEGNIIFNDIYDLLIIAPEKFVESLQKLKEHKENHGMRTLLRTTEEIYQSYNGRDDAEKVKYAIKDAVEKYGIKYVLLVGGMKGQRFKWYVPVRYSHLDDNSSWECSYLSDLYFADIYKYEDGIAFEDWDSNGNGIFAEWNKMNKDVLDLYPDVYVGRLPCRYKWEVDLMVDKIITYENNAYGKEWFKRMVVIGGDSFPDIEVGTDYIEGQVECDYALSFMGGFEHVKIYVEGGDIQFTPENAVNELSKGEGFVYFSGHGNPASWATHPHNDFNTWIDFGLNSIRKLSNGDKLPIVIVGGCHNCQFNVSIFKFLEKGIWAYYLGEMTPECWGWLFTRKVGGGSIATIGNTGLGYGTIGDGPVDEVPDSVPDGIPDCIQYLGGWLEPHFFKVYNKDGKDVLGEAWGTNLIDYLNEFPIDWNKEWTGIKPEGTIDLVNCKTVQEWVLLGDPSLKIGGYSS